MRIAICDDCKEDATYLAGLLSDHKCFTYTAPRQLLLAAEYVSDGFDLYLLDICMGNDSGITLADKIRQKYEDAPICFVSSSEDYYREAYDLMDVNYLLKPVSEQALSKLLERVRRNQAMDKSKRFSFKYGSSAVTVPYSSILFLSSSGHTVSLVGKDGREWTFKAKLSDVEAQLDADIFVRCHQSFLVNIYHLDHVDGNDLVIGDHRIPISRRYYADLRKRYLAMLFEEVE